VKNDMIFLSNSIDDAEKDIIGFNTYVEKLNSAIDENAQMIAITSPFGSGKTSIVELLKKKRKNKKNEKFLHVQMWSELGGEKEENNSCELHKNFLYQIGSAINPKKGTYINRRLSNNYGLLKLHSNRPVYWICLVMALLFIGFGWLSKNHSDIVLKYIPFLNNLIDYIPAVLFALAIVCLLVILIGAEIIFSSRNSETQRVVEPDEIIDLYRNEIINKKSRFISFVYRCLKKVPLIKRLSFLEGTKYIVIIEDLDRTNDGAAVIHFLKELRKYYILSNKEGNVSQNRVVFIVNIKPESSLNDEVCDADVDKNTNIVDEDQKSTTNSNEEISERRDTLYFKLFDYVLNLQTINITDYDTILCGLLEENKEYLQKYSLSSTSGKLSDIPGMQWIIRGKRLGIREIKNRLNIASVIFETLKERFPLTQDGIEFKKCAAAAYVMTEFEQEFSKTDDKAFEELSKLYLQKKLEVQTAKELLSTESDYYTKAIVELVEAKLISEDYRMYYYNYPKNSVIYSSDESNIQNAILYGTPCKHFELVAKRVVEGNSDIVEKNLNKLKLLGLPIPQIVVKNESLFLSALKYDESYVIEIFNRIKDTDEALDKNIASIIDILKYDGYRKVYTPKIISSFCSCWEKVFCENHLISLRETICSFFGREIHLYKQLFFGDHSTITIKEMSLLPFQDAIELLNIESKNFSVSHLKYIVNRFKEEVDAREIVNDRIREILIYSCDAFASKEIAEIILNYMLVSKIIIDKLEETVWNLLNEEPVDSDEEEAEITLEKQNEIFKKYKEVVNSIPVTNVPEIVLKHINTIDDFDDPYGYSIEISNLLFEHGYHFMSVLVKLRNEDSIDFSNKDIIDGIKDSISWAVNHQKTFLGLRRKILLYAPNIFDYQFCFSSEFPLLSKDEFLLLTNNTRVTLSNVLDFFPEDIMNEEAVEYISKHFNKKHSSNYDAFEVIEKLLKYSSTIIKSFFGKIDFSHAFLYYTFAEWRKERIKHIFQEALELDTYEGKLMFMEWTRYLDEKFEEELIGNTDENMETRYVKLVARRLGPNSISSMTIEMLKSFNRYYVFSDYSGINEKLFDAEEYEYYIVSKTQSTKKFIMEEGERLDKIWPTYIEIFSNPSRFSKTVSCMRANEAFLEKIMTSGIYTGFEENALEQLSAIKQDENLITHVYARGSAFAIKYFSLIKAGFVDYEAAKTYVDLLSLDANRPVLKSDAVRNNVYDKLVDPVLKRKYTRLRKSYGYEQ